MTVPNPAHFFDQADKLASPRRAGPPRQADLRRAISTAYYGLFHFTLAALADEFVGVSQRATARYVLVYRSVDHRTLKELCKELQKQTPSQRYAACFPANGLGTDIQAFATTMIELQRKRLEADYDPGLRFKTLDARLATAFARSAVQRFARASQDRKKTFLTLLLCPPR